MQLLIAKIKGDYLQRTRSYSFLITLAISLYVAYTFVPPPDAPYTTMRIGIYIGDFNSAWIGHVTAIMTSVFLSMIGFFLVNNSVKKDIETEVGMIIATTSVSNFRYLMSKTISNFLVLVTIMSLVLAMSIGVFFFRSAGFDFELMSFLKPYCFVTLPALFFISALAILSEVLLGRRSVLQYIGFFVLFNVIMGTVQTAQGSTLVTLLDPFGVKVVTMGFQDFVKNQLGGDGLVTSMGFIFGSKDKLKTFQFTGMEWPTIFLISRVCWIGFSVALVYGASMIFHRFDLREQLKSIKKPKALIDNQHQSVQTISLTSVPTVVEDYSIKAFIKTELLLLIRKGSRWLWLLNIGLMIAMIFVPLSIAHQFLLPILWFLQVSRLSELTTREKTNRVHHFSFAAYRPVARLLPAQILAGLILMIILALPLLLRYTISLHTLSVLGIVTGGAFIVILSSALGIATRGKKLFEIVFFLITYANVNRIPFADYFGFNVSVYSISLVAALSFFFLLISLMARSYEISRA